ncbi:MAG: AraC family transcriptional regulator [Firmicutes bacterium]|nr:AraC family transcriptional regulator [Bacillota bacterium]
MKSIASIDPQNLIKRPGLQEDSPTKRSAESQFYDLDVTPDSQWILVHASAKAQETLLYVQEAGEFIARSHYFTKRRSVNSYLIKITMDGEGLLEYDGQKYQCQSGSFFWIDCKNPHYYGTAPGAEHWHVVWIHFLGGEAQQYYKNFMEASGGSPVGQLKSSGKAAQLVREIIERYIQTRSDYYGDIQTAAGVTNLLTQCLGETVQNASKQQFPERMQQVYDYITENFTQRLTLEDLAARFFINKFYLQKQFRQYIGKSPCEYQNELRIDYAKELLRMTNLSVSEICQYLGLESTSYFIQLFKKREGVTPLQFRNSWVWG